MLAAGKSLTEVYQKLGIAESTWMRWKAKYGGMKRESARRLVDLEDENKRLKEMLAEAELDKRILTRPPRETSEPGRPRRDAVCHIMAAIGVSRRRACDAQGVPRSTYRYKPTAKPEEAKLLARILELVKDPPRYGYRRITLLLRREGWASTGSGSTGFGYAKA